MISTCTLYGIPMSGAAGNLKHNSVAQQRLIGFDIVAVLVSSALGAWSAGRFGWNISVPFLGVGAKVVTPTFVVLWVVALSVNGAWDVRLVVAGTEYYVRALRATIAAFVAIGLVGFVASVDAARPFVLFALPIGTPIIIANRWLVRSWSRRKSPVLRALIVGENHRETELALTADSALRVQVVGCVARDGLLGVFESLAKVDADLVVVGANHGLSQQDLRELLWKLDEMQIEVWFDAATQFIRSGRGALIPSKNTTLMVFDPIHLSEGQRLVKRLFDIGLSALALIVLFPVLVVAVLVMVLKDRRSVLFRQQRLGLDGNEFTIWKLRTMVGGDAQEAPNGMTKNPDDPRVTPVGRVLRRWSIDEIPQFWNVLKGDMSVVGPRPRLPEEVVVSSVSSRRLRAKPGITGPWQTSGRSLMPFAEADALDVNYVDSWSLLGDVVIVLRTVRVVLSGHGAF